MMSVSLGLGLAIFMIILFLASFALFVLAFIFWIFMIVDCAKRKFKNETDKVVWILVIVLLSWLGALIYYFVVKRENKI